MAKNRVLVIAGSDSSGGAGLEADQKVLATHGCYAMTATTALTAQNTLGVHDIHVIPSEFVTKQIDACLEDIGADVVKLGMLASAKTVTAVTVALQRHRVSSIVLDPVMVSTSGAELLPKDAVRDLRLKLLPMATILTPNIPEAKLLLQDAGHQVEDPNNLDDAINLAKIVQTLGPKNVLLKGGHMPLTKEHLRPSGPNEAATVIDVLYDGNSTLLFDRDFLRSSNTHGTGCSLASAIASGLALGVDIQSAVRTAIRYVENGIKTSFDMGKGSGPINHFHSLYSLPFAPSRFLGYLQDQSSSQIGGIDFSELVRDDDVPGENAESSRDATDLLKKKLLKLSPKRIDDLHKLLWLVKRDSFFSNRNGEHQNFKKN